MNDTQAETRNTGGSHKANVGMAHTDSADWLGWYIQTVSTGWDGTYRQCRLVGMVHTDSVDWLGWYIQTVSTGWDGTYRQCRLVGMAHTDSADWQLPTFRLNLRDQVVHVEIIQHSGPSGTHGDNSIFGTKWYTWR